MLTGLGKPAAPGDAVDLLLECHARIRGFLALARRLGEARGAPADAVADAAFRVHRYFTLPPTSPGRSRSCFRRSGGSSTARPTPPS